MRLTIDTPLAPMRATLLGLLLLAPGVWFLGANLLNDAGVSFLWGPFEALVSSTGLQRAFNLVSPVIFLGGAALALLLNLLAIGRYDVKWEHGQLVGSAAIMTRPLNVAVVFGCGVVLAAFLGYAFAENFRIVPTHV